MKKRYIAVLAAILILGFSSLAKATLFADFWAVDVDHNGVTLDFNLYSPPVTLWFSTDQSNWIRLFKAESPFSALSTTLTLEDTTHLYLKLAPLSMLTSVSTVAPSAVETPKVTFNGPYADKLYNSLSIQWGTGDNPFPLSFITPEGGDKFASESPVPIPDAALLFGTGLIGFIGARRKIRIKTA
jgi:hypothetical protein